MGRLLDEDDVIEAIANGNVHVIVAEDGHIYGRMDEVLDAIESLPSTPQLKDCRTCKYGDYNDHYDMEFCYSTEDCNNWEKWEARI